MFRLKVQRNIHPSFGFNDFLFFPHIFVGLIGQILFTFLFGEMDLPLTWSSGSLTSSPSTSSCPTSSCKKSVNSVYTLRDEIMAFVLETNECVKQLWHYLHWAIVNSIWLKSAVLLCYHCSRVVVYQNSWF